MKLMAKKDCKRLCVAAKGRPGAVLVCSLWASSHKGRGSALVWHLLHASLRCVSSLRRAARAVLICAACLTLAGAALIFSARLPCAGAVIVCPVWAFLRKSRAETPHPLPRPLNLATQCVACVAWLGLGARLETYGQEGLQEALRCSQGAPRGRASLLFVGILAQGPRICPCLASLAC